MHYYFFIRFRHCLPAALAKLSFANSVYLFLLPCLCWLLAICGNIRCAFLWRFFLTLHYSNLYTVLSVLYCVCLSLDFLPHLYYNCDKDKNQHNCHYQINIVTNTDKTRKVERMSDKLNIKLDRLKRLIDTKTREQIAEALKCDTSTVTKHYNGDRRITIDYLVKYAQYFDVSTDYLLGLTDVATTDKDLQYICDYTGLEEAAVKELRNATHGADDFFEQPTEEYTKFIQEQRKAINGFLKSDFFSDLVECFIIQQSVNQKVNDKLTHIKTDESEKAKYLLYRTAINIDLKDEQDLNIYRAQTTILDYLRTLQTYTQDDFRFISNYYFEKGMNDYFAENPQNEKGENDE